mgnify:CR=1 FL=1
MPNRRTLVVLLFATLCAAAATLLDFTSPDYYRQTESRIRDAIARSGRTTPANPDLLFLAIDSDSVTLDETLDLQGLFSSSSSDPRSRRALEIMSRGWPWNREIYAMILERLVRAGAKVVAFDCLFSASAPVMMPFVSHWRNSRLTRLLEAISFLLTTSSDRPEFLPAMSRRPKR